MDVTASKKRKSKAQEENVEKTKKPRSAYLLYYFDVHQILQQEFPNLPQSEVNKRISESWKRLSVAEKSYYLEKAKSEKEGTDTSLSLSKDLPGFRKILPRASYFLLSKSCSSNHQLGIFQPEVILDSLDPRDDGGLTSISLTQEHQFPTLGLAGEVELSEQPIIVSDVVEESAVLSCPTVLQGIPSSSSSSASSSISSKPLAPTDASQGSANPTANGATTKEDEMRLSSNGYGGTMVQQIQAETTQVVAIIPTQNMLEPESIASVSSVGPVMMVSVGPNIEQSAKPSYKMFGTLLDPYQPLSPEQKEIQHQNTLQLLRHTLQIPESETELQETLKLIQELNSLQIVLVQADDQRHEDGVETVIESGWPQFYESAATHCGLCNYPLFKGDQSFLTGLFNIGNKLLVSIDLFLKMRASIKVGKAPTQAAQSIVDHVPSHPVHSLSPEEFSQIQELILSGYWAFECLTVRDYNDMICGICGVAPKVEIAQRYSNNVLELTNVEFTWPECSVSDEVYVDDFWLTMESEAIEQAAFPTDIPITRVDASIIAPFIPPLMRSPTVINTEKDKMLLDTQPPTGDPSVLVRLIHDGQLRLNKIEDHSEAELRTILDHCGVNVTPGSTKNELLASLLSFYSLVHSGLSTAPQPPTHLTAGKLSKICPHKVVCGSKCLVRGETARDHVDLLLSSRFWPPVYVSDSARKVALCTDMQYPELATQMWGRNQGCFSDPFENSEFVSCAELQDQPYSADLSLVAENQQMHPITKSSSCWMVHPPGAEQPSEPSAPASDHHSMSLCRDLEPYVSLVAELEKEKEEEYEEQGEQKQQIDKAERVSTDQSEDCSSVSYARRQPVVFNNTAFYYLYNRLVDYLTSRDIVTQQINQVVKACQPGEVVIRDALYRLGVAQIKREMEGEGQEGQIETYEVVLPE
ncbi:HMG domain-containing protein 3 HMG box-containing protein 3 Protein SMF [Channa argus]|uniref:HMG domain-containing protein 3 HMG box-containing protein 3 Protein SMF n=1 Tax=Channa argus TaxID=215402 RepID=A0A6G1PUB1_CHAAH|nr:HMG domain-containing protein 3 HMG box-containing protein 3 Protein SMF [Channa argus]